MSAERWYLDSSAFVKLVLNEPESHALDRWVTGRSLVSSDLFRTEARRAVASETVGIRRRCHQLLDVIPMIQIMPYLFDRAGDLPVGGLRSLDAIHLACAQELGSDLAGLVSYDRRQIKAATSLDLPVVSPGRSVS